MKSCFFYLQLILRRNLLQIDCLTVGKRSKAVSNEKVATTKQREKLQTSHDFRREVLVVSSFPIVKTPKGLLMWGRRLWTFQSSR